MQSLIYIGCGVLLFGAVFLSLGLRRGIGLGVSETEEFLSALRHLRDGMRCYLKTPTEALSDFKSEGLSRIGFLPIGDEGIGAAFSRCSDHSHMSRDAKALLGECFSRLGDGYLDDELLRLDGYIARLEELSLKEEAEGARRGKVLTVVFTAAAMLVVILTV